MKLKYLRIRTRGRWLVTVHLMADAGIRTLCGRTLAGFQAATEIGNEQPEGCICRQCQNELEKRKVIP
ncbi:hypothetical protein GC175_17130 [bacterium]|nr:hypothetical protein [bacterium]